MTYVWVLGRKSCQHRDRTAVYRTGGKLMGGFAGPAKAARMKRKLVGTPPALTLIGAWLAPAASANPGALPAGGAGGPGQIAGNGYAGSRDGAGPGVNRGGTNDRGCDRSGWHDCGPCPSRSRGEDCECPPGSADGDYCECPPGSHGERCERPPGSAGGDYCEYPPGSDGDHCECPPRSHRPHGCKPDRPGRPGHPGRDHNQGSGWDPRWLRYPGGDGSAFSLPTAVWLKLTGAPQPGRGTPARSPF